MAAKATPRSTINKALGGVCTQSATAPAKDAAHRRNGKAGGEAVKVLLAVHAPLVPLIDRLPAACVQAKTYRIHCVSPADAGALGRALTNAAPRVLLIDVELCARFGMTALRHLCHAAPAIDWMLLWPEPSARWHETILNTVARGAVREDASAGQLERALAAVLSGELWFPRAVMQALYVSLLGHALTPLAATGSHDPAGPDLTRREAEVLALMRQGLSNKQIGSRLGISINTVKKHLAGAFVKRGLHHRRQSVDR